MATSTATSISEAIIPSPVAKVLQWTKQVVAPSASATASVEKEGEVVVATPGAVQTQRELKQSKETEKNEKTKRERGRDMGAANTADKKTGAKTGAADTTPISGGLGKGGKRPKVQLKAEVKFELEVDTEEATQVGVCIQFQSRWEGFTLRQVMKDMVKRSTRYVRRATWCYVGRALRFAASYV